MRLNHVQPSQACNAAIHPLPYAAPFSLLGFVSRFPTSSHTLSIHSAMAEEGDKFGGGAVTPAAAAPQASPKIILKNIDMSEKMRNDAIDCARAVRLRPSFVSSAFEKHRLEKDIAEYIKKEFDMKYGQTWHCIIAMSPALIAHQYSMPNWKQFVTDVGDPFFPVNDHPKFGVHLSVLSLPVKSKLKMCRMITSHQRQNPRSPTAAVANPVGRAAHPRAMGVDLVAHQRSKKVRRTASKSDDAYLKLLVRVFGAEDREQVQCSDPKELPQKTDNFHDRKCQANKVAVIVGTVTDDKRVYEVPSYQGDGFEVYRDSKGVDPQGRGPKNAREAVKHFGKAPGVPHSHTNPMSARREGSSRRLEEGETHKELENFLWDMEQYFLAARVLETEKVIISSMYLGGDVKLWCRTRMVDDANNVRDLLDAIVVVDVLSNFHSNKESLDVSSPPKFMKNRKEETELKKDSANNRWNDRKDHSAAQGNNLKNQGCFLCNESHLVRDCPKQEKLNVLLAKEDDEHHIQEVVSLINPLPLLTSIVGIDANGNKGNVEVYEESISKVVGDYAGAGGLHTEVFDEGIEIF
ncbi:hypothetical protein ZIOFF_054904 [Zingiber officinale]|uniref:Large ribosomal subunit protein uL15/eL18 domain-containing protein n=1 Tax=Zingiber officinale TaxID=94328 RepID=A0A8J5KPM5_ZINOF|nr:hypothetical protein ZIOFF_054904 [Zingiber officinale]